MPSYKALYEQQLQKNKEHEEKIYELESEIVDLVDVRDIAEILGEDPEDYMRYCCAYTLAKKIKEHREMEEENKKLKAENKTTKIELHKLTQEHKKLQKKMKNIKKDWEEEKEWVKEEGRDEAIAEYDKLAFVIGGQYQPNNPSLMIKRVELMEHENQQLKDKVKCLYKKNKIEIVELKQSEKYWKNFALIYWSGDQLGDNSGVIEGGEVWDNALEKFEDPKDKTSREELTKKCLL